MYGYSDPENMSIHIRALYSPLIWNQKREYFRIKYDKKDSILSDLKLKCWHKSVVVHEVSHILSQYNFNKLSNKKINTTTEMGRGVQEYIASVAQLSYIDAVSEGCLLGYILREYDPLVRFEYENQINSMLFSISPQEFAIMSIRHFHSMSDSEQLLFMKRILSGDLNPDLDMEFMLNEKEIPFFSTNITEKLKEVTLTSERQPSN